MIIVDTWSVPSPSRSDERIETDAPAARVEHVGRGRAGRGSIGAAGLLRERSDRDGRGSDGRAGVGAARQGRGHDVVRRLENGCVDHISQINSLR